MGEKELESDIAWLVHTKKQTFLPLATGLRCDLPFGQKVVASPRVVVLPPSQLDFDDSLSKWSGRKVLATQSHLAFSESQVEPRDKRVHCLVGDRESSAFRARRVPILPSKGREWILLGENPILGFDQLGVQCWKNRRSKIEPVYFVAQVEPPP